MLADLTLTIITSNTALLFG